MKRIFLAFFMLCVVAPAWADIVPKEMKPIYVRAQITNLDAYSGYVFIQLETLGREIRGKTIIPPDGSVRKGYKLNQLWILAVPKEDFQASGGLDGTDLLTDPRIARSGPNAVESGQQLVHRHSPLAGKTLFYTVAINGSELAFEKTGETSSPDVSGHWDLLLLSRAFGVTFIVELMVFMMLIRWVASGQVPGKGRAFLGVFSAQTLTLPLLWILISHYSLFSMSVILGAEVFAVIAEALIYRFFLRLKWGSAFMVSVVCNTASYLVGLMI